MMMMLVIVLSQHQTEQDSFWGLARGASALRLRAAAKPASWSTKSRAHCVAEFKVREHASACNCTCGRRTGGRACTREARCSGAKSGLAAKRSAASRSADSGLARLDAACISGCSRG